MCTVFPTNKTTHAIHPNETNCPHTIYPNDTNRPTRNLAKRNRRGGACVPARTSAQRRFHTKNTCIVRGELNDGCALAGRRGRAHRHRPYQTPSYFSTQSYTNKITIYTQSAQTKRVNNLHTLGGGNASRTPAPILKIKKCVYVMISASPWMTPFVLKQIILWVPRG